MAKGSGSGGRSGRGGSPQSAWRTRELTAWQSGGISASRAKEDIKYFKRRVARLNRDLKTQQNIASYERGGRQEIARQQVKQIKKEISFARDMIENNQWLLKQPKA